MRELNKLVTRAQNGDIDAFNVLVIRFQDMALRCAYSFLKDFQLSQDAAQEAFVRAFKSLHSLRSPDAFVAWFRCIVFSRCNRITRRNHLDPVALDDEVLQSPIQNPLDQLEVREREVLISRAIQALPAEECQITTLFYFGEYSHSEIADFLDIPTYTVNNRLRKARKSLKKWLILLHKDIPNRNRLSANKFR
ncbi:MAG: sigma-70 family RNA polymerase sigma factor [Candidatus Latescibacteria bacterium]|jgi:RNA polymerase sigma factor (sigma-70 family)|nr:sigma-70 family RNA polymerase sigma factor [Candidatus Latescibacterota bacterium]MBT5832115.1 sigma-70 family RNA polymerase sigma factor [Candidatus Latescibacterota bacterium]